MTGLSVCVALLMAVAGRYLTRVRVPRPPVGVYVPADIVLMCVGVVLAPLIYLALPGAVDSALFGLVLCLAVQFTLAPVCGGRWAWRLALSAAAVTVGCDVVAGGSDVGVRVCTDVLLATAVVGVTNLWVQSGLRASHTAALAGALACYDLVATTLTHVTGRFADQVAGRPFAPILALTGGSRPVAVGLGDLLLLVLFPLVTAKAYGRTAAVVAALAGVAVTSAISGLFALGALSSGFPLLTALGPLIVAQYAVWSRRAGGERTTAAWRAGAVPGADRRSTEPDPRLGAALTAALPEGVPEGTWLAVHDGQVLAAAPSPGRALHEARLRAPGCDPVVRQP